VGELWNEVKAKLDADAEKRQRSEDLARSKVPPIRGLSEETMAEIEDGTCDLPDDGNPQTKILRKLTGLE
jgi:hypothetical protein